jgi:hypothetical protein
MPTWCCGERDSEKSPRVGTPDVSAAQPSHDQDGAKLELKSLAARHSFSSGAYANLIVKVERAEGLMGMDITLNSSSLQLESTLDALVSMSVNHGDPFGETSTQWQSTGSPFWNEDFSVELRHPQSFLCLKVLDDDPVLRHNSALAHDRDCGWIEVPLAHLPRNVPVTGWFSLNHPELDREDAGKAQDASARSEKSADSSKQSPPHSARELRDAGRIKLHLLMQTSATREFFANIKPAPVFKALLPPLNVPLFLEDITEIKRLIVQRLIVPPISAFFYAISWEAPVLSLLMICWHIFVCYHKEYISASLWVVFALLFWHKIPEQKVEKDPKEEAAKRASIGDGLTKGTATFLEESKAGVTAAFWKPIEGAKKGGIKGWANGIKEGAEGNIAHTVAAWQGMTKEIGQGIGSSFDQLGMHGIGLNEFQNLLLVMRGQAFARYDSSWLAANFPQHTNNAAAHRRFLLLGECPNHRTVPLHCDSCFRGRPCL